MNTQTDDIDRRGAVQVLRLRLHDWMWPCAVAAAITIPFLGRSSGTYPAGSVTDWANTYGLPLVLALLAFAGIRWCWIGRTLPRDPAQGATGRLPRTRRPVARLLLDLPGLLVAGYAVFIAAMLMLAVLGVIELD